MTTTTTFKHSKLEHAAYATQAAKYRVIRVPSSPDPGFEILMYTPGFTLDQIQVRAFPEGACSQQASALQRHRLFPECVCSDYLSIVRLLQTAHTWES